jgi:hypothetical protein
MDVQAWILPALAAIHNIILKHDREDIENFDDNSGDPFPGQCPDEVYGHLADDEKTKVTELRDQIAQAMWQSYQSVLRARGEGADDE